MVDVTSLFPRNFGQQYIEVERGKGIYLFGADGRAYLDAAAGAISANIGYGVEEIAEAIYEQTSKLPFAHASCWAAEINERAASLVAELAPEGMNLVWFVNSGSEAMEAAIKMARQYFIEKEGKGSSRHLVIGRQNSYHGSSLGTLAISGSVVRRRHFLPMLFDQPKLETHYCYRCPFGLEKTSCGIRCATELETVIRRIGPHYVAAFVAEPIVGSTVGALVPPDEYWPIVRDICTRYDILLIADEVMTGCGRTGKNFCVDHWGVKPDLIGTAKGLAASYYPVGAVIVADHVGEVFRNGSGIFAHSHTFNGMPAGSAAVVAVLEYMKKHNLVENAARMGKLIEMDIAPELRKMPLVGEVRGRGLMWGIELVRDKATKTPFDASVDAGGKLKALALERGMTLYPGRAMADGVNGDNIMIGPPLTVTEEDVRKIFEILLDSLKNLQNLLKI